MKLEIGMYVRYKKFSYSKEIKIGKLTNVQFQLVDGDSGRQDILKASHNIIDLIEVGDYVNGKKVTSIIPPDILGDEVLDYAHISSLNGEPLYEDIEIKSIVTKEQFESMSYKVGE